MEIVDMKKLLFFITIIFGISFCDTFGIKTDQKKTKRKKASSTQEHRNGFKTANEDINDENNDKNRNQKNPPTTGNRTGRKRKRKQEKNPNDESQSPRKRTKITITIPKTLLPILGEAPPYYHVNQSETNEEYLLDTNILNNAYNKAFNEKKTINEKLWNETLKMIPQLAWYKKVERERDTLTNIIINEKLTYNEIYKTICLYMIKKYIQHKEQQNRTLNKINRLTNPTRRQIDDTLRNILPRGIFISISKKTYIITKKIFARIYKFINEIINKIIKETNLYNKIIYNKPSYEDKKTIFEIFQRLYNNDTNIQGYYNEMQRECKNEIDRYIKEANEKIKNIKQDYSNEIQQAITNNINIQDIIQEAEQKIQRTQQHYKSIIQDIEQNYNLVKSEIGKIINSIKKNIENIKNSYINHQPVKNSLFYIYKKMSHYLLNTYNDNIEAYKRMLTLSYVAYDIPSISIPTFMAITTKFYKNNPHESFVNFFTKSKFDIQFSIMIEHFLLFKSFLNFKKIITEKIEITPLKNQLELYHCYNLNNYNLNNYLKPSVLRKRGILPLDIYLRKKILEKEEEEEEEEEKEDTVIENIKKIAEQCTQHPNLHQFFDTIPECPFKKELVSKIVEYAKKILLLEDPNEISSIPKLKEILLTLYDKKTSSFQKILDMLLTEDLQKIKQQFYDNLPFGILKTAIELLARILNPRININTNPKAPDAIAEIVIAIINQDNGEIGFDFNGINRSYFMEKTTDYALLLLQNLTSNTIKDISIYNHPKLKHITGLHNIKSMTINNCLQLRQIVLKDLTELRINSAMITPLTIQAPNLTTLILDNCNLSLLNLQQTNIKKLYLIWCTNVKQITPLKNLESFILEKYEEIKINADNYMFYHYTYTKPEENNHLGVDLVQHIYIDDKTLQNIRYKQENINSNIDDQEILKEMEDE
jgi:hypothetical protein